MLDTRMAFWIEHLSPLTGLLHLYLCLFPRLTPWATLCRPFGASGYVSVSAVFSENPVQ
jgi:hypothetical protein